MRKHKTLNLILIITIELIDNLKLLFRNNQYLDEIIFNLEDSSKHNCATNLAKNSMRNNKSTQVSVPIQHSNNLYRRALHDLTTQHSVTHWITKPTSPPYIIWHTGETWGCQEWMGLIESVRADVRVVKGTCREFVWNPWSWEYYLINCSIICSIFRYNIKLISLYIKVIYQIYIWYFVGFVIRSPTNWNPTSPVWSFEAIFAGCWGVSGSKVGSKFVPNHYCWLEKRKLCQYSSILSNN